LQFLIIGNPGCPRVAGFQSALASQGLPPAEVVHHADLLRHQVHLASRVKPGTVVRLESPGRDFEVEKLLLCAGYEPARAQGAPALSPQAIASLRLDPGLILHPRQWYLGWQVYLQHLKAQLAQAPPHHFLNDTDEVSLLFDKPACQARLARAGIPVPRALPKPTCFEELRANIQAASLDRVFVKLAHGSSASGVVAWNLRRPPGQALTTVELVRCGAEVRLYNSRRIRLYRREGDLVAILDRLCQEGVQVEQWLAKAALPNGWFDLRLLVIGGEARHTVVRLSRSPLTNLHLGNTRADLALLLERMSVGAWETARATCVRAARMVPRSLQVGVDLLIGPDFQRHAILEMNAFGDLLHGIQDRGMDTYTAEVLCVLKEKSGGSSRARACQV
jgi:hypothetical protein